MHNVRFEWDDAKDRSNRRKHKVSFDEAVTVFYDEHALFMDDPDHSDEEDRFLILGLSAGAREIIVSHCYRSAEAVIRIISARRADREEREQYWARLP